MRNQILLLTALCIYKIVWFFHRLSQKKIRNLKSFKITFNLESTLKNKSNNFQISFSLYPQKSWEVWKPLLYYLQFSYFSKLDIRKLPKTSLMNYSTIIIIITIKIISQQFHRSLKLIDVLSLLGLTKLRILKSLITENWQI